ncbi:MAG: tetratricopeptide repeat protein, partial [Cyanobacteria bacterium J06639_1]
MSNHFTGAIAWLAAGGLVSIIPLAPLPLLAQEQLIQTPPVLVEPSLNPILQDAVDAVARSDWSAAARLYREAIAISPNEAALYNNLGVAERR